MPIIHVTAPTGILDQTQRNAIAAQLTDIIMDIEGTRGNPVFAAGTWLQLIESEASSIAVGGQFTTGRYQVIIDLPADALTMAQKADLISRVTDALLRIEGKEPDAQQRARVYCLINEIPDGGWGFAGQAITRAYIAALYTSSLKPCVAVG